MLGRSVYRPNPGERARSDAISEGVASPEMVNEPTMAPLRLKSWPPVSRAEGRPLGTVLVIPKRWKN
jgi:hypothetical protein